MAQIEEMLERMRKLRDGKTVTCKRCGQGIMKPIGDCKTARCFVCDKCESRINID